MTWAIHQGDALELLGNMPYGRLDACVTDPPYGERIATWDAQRPREWWVEWLTLVDLVLKPRAPIVTFCSRRQVDIVMGALREVRGDSPACPLQTGAWVHRQGHLTGNPGFLRPEHEPFIVSGLLRATASDVRALRQYRTPHNLERRPTHRRSPTNGFKAHTYEPSEHGPVAGTVIECARNKPAERTGYPTQKPEALIAQLVACACPPGGTVLDPFCGSGTTLVVALQLGRHASGIDSNQRAVSIARARVMRDGAPLFNAEAIG